MGLLQKTTIRNAIQLKQETNQRPSISVLASYLFMSLPNNLISGYFTHLYSGTRDNYTYQHWN